MKKVSMTIFILLGIIFLSGCGQQEKESQNKVQDQDEKKINKEEFSLSDSNTYKNEKYNFTIQYPKTWRVDEDKTLAGPGFIPSNLSLQDIQAGKFNKEKDCFFNIVLLSVSQNKTIPCKNNLGEVTIGSNKFVKCNLGGFRYMLLHPKTSNIISFEYLDNISCKAIFEKSLETLIFR